ncbi:thymidylate kinase isoform X5 [Carlito syrichta]|uniref:Thymidylate kinase isoform X5 n=1 Tax=Carlito syrichta TaxID=1868482 RepID=A0A3Q0DHZ2_CARSF|nr:thymidylate kinase isoform X5 [Carlito syrichta]
MAGRRGALIVLEGVDRAGKTTQCCKLVEALCDAGQRAQMLRFPERSTEIGKLLSSYLEKKSEIEAHAVHLLFSANRWEQLYFSNHWVLYWQNFSLDWCKQPDVGLPKPDLVLFLQLQLADAAKREGFGCELYENQAFQKQVLQRFYQLMEDPTLNWKIVDASKSFEEVHEEIRTVSEATICTAAQRPLEELWK